MTKTMSQMSLASVTSGVMKLPTRTLIYGLDGIGKTTWAADAPVPIFIPTEEGATRVAVAKFPLCRSWKDVLNALRTLYSENHDYKTVVLDSADWAQALAIEHIVTRDYQGDMAAFDAYGRGYKVVMTEWRNFLGALDSVRRKKDMEVILIAHAVVRTFKNPSGDDFDKYESNLHTGQSTSIWARTKEWCDILLFANYQLVVKKADPRAQKGKAVMLAGDGARVCHAAPSASWDAKVRAGWSLPAQFPLNQSQFRKYLEKDGDEHAIQS